MKVLLISPLPPPNGGIASWTVQYLEYAKAMPLDVHLINNNVVGSRVENLSNRYVLKDELKRYTKIRSQLKKELKTFKPDIIHYNIPCSPKGIIRDYLLMKSIGSRSKTAVHLRCTPEDQLKGSRIGLYFFKKVVKLADAVMTLNTPTVDFIQKLTGKKAAATANFISEDDIKSDALHTGKLEKLFTQAISRKQKESTSCWRRQKSFLAFISRLLAIYPPITAIGLFRVMFSL